MSALLWSIPAVPIAVAALIAAMGHRLRAATGWLVTGAAAWAFAAAIPLAGSDLRSSVSWFETERLSFTVGLRADGVAVSFALLVAVISALVDVYAIGYMREKEGRARLFAWMAFFEGAMLALVLADSFVVLFAAWEGVGLASWALIGHEHDRAQARRAGAEAFLVTRLGDLAMLGGWLVAVLATRSTDLTALVSAARTGAVSPRLALALSLLFVVAALTKSAQLPFSAWLPDAMIGPTPVSALLHSATMVAAGAFLLLRLWPLFEAAPGALAVLRWVGIATAVAAALAATAQDDLKAVLAWSTVDQLGLMMLALGLSGPGAAALQLFAHAVFKAGLFLVAGIVDEAAGTRALSRLGGLGRTMPWGAVAFAACALSLAAFPPFAGFASGDAILARAAGTSFGWGIAVVGLVLLAGAYAGRAFAGVFLSWPGAPAPRPRALPGTMLAAALLLAAGAVGAGWGLQGPVARALAYAEPPEVAGAWRFVAIAASAAGLMLGVATTRMRGPAPLLGRWVGAVPAAAAAVTSASARTAVAAAAATSRLESALDRRAERTGSTAVTVAAAADSAEHGLDRAARAGAAGAFAVALGVDVVERRGVSDGLDRGATAVGALGDRVRRAQPGPLYVYTAAVAAFVLLAAAAAIVVSALASPVQVAGG